MFGLPIFGNKSREGAAADLPMCETAEVELDDYESGKFYEITTVHQEDPRFLKRWFTTNAGTVNLYIWESTTQQKIVRFEFCYTTFWEEKMIRWQSDRGWQFAIVDTDETAKLSKSAAILQVTDEIDPEEALQIFRNHASISDKGIFSFVEMQFAKWLASH